jgi:hypothetical protein
LLDILREFRQAIIDETAEEYLKQFINEYYSKEEEGVPAWVKDACKAGGIELD